MPARQPSPFDNLGKPHSEPISPAVPLEKAVARSTRAPRPQQEAGDQSSATADRQNGGLAERQRSTTPQTTPSDGKIGYRISLDAIEAIKDIETELRRKHRITARLRRIVEAAVFAAYEDLKQNGANSELIKRLSTTEPRKTTAMEER